MHFFSLWSTYHIQGRWNGFLPGYLCFYFTKATFLRGMTICHLKNHCNKNVSQRWVEFDNKLIWICLQLSFLIKWYHIHFQKSTKYFSKLTLFACYQCRNHPNTSQNLFCSLAINFHVSSNTLSENWVVNKSKSTHCPTQLIKCADNSNTSFS